MSAVDQFSSDLHSLAISFRASPDIEVRWLATMVDTFRSTVNRVLNGTLSEIEERSVAAFRLREIGEIRAGLEAQLARLSHEERTLREAILPHDLRLENS